MLIVPHPLRSKKLEFDSPDFYREFTPMPKKPRESTEPDRSRKPAAGIAMEWRVNRRQALRTAGTIAGAAIVTPLGRAAQDDTPTTLSETE